jgi:proteasome lid subunit RPN8/RPN11
MSGTRHLRPEVRLPSALAEEILNHCQSVRPEEACGLVAADSKGEPVAIIPVTNALHSPVRYQMETREQFDAMKRLRREGWSLWAIFHSHPHSEPAPSPTDIRLAFYPDCHYLIAGLGTDPPVIRCFTIVDGKVSEAPLRLIS